MSDPSVIPAAIRRYLSDFVARRRRVALMRSVGGACVFAMLWLMLWAVIDRLLPFSPAQRVILLIVDAAVCISFLIRPMRAMLSRQFDWTIAAAQVERRDPRLVGRLETAVSQLLLAAPMQGSPQLVDRIVSEADSLSAQHVAVKYVPVQSAMKPWMIVLFIALSGALLTTSAWLDLPTLLKRQLLPLAAIAPVTTTRIQVEPGSVDVSQGGAVSITARATRLGSTPLSIRLTSEGRDSSLQPMKQLGDGRFSFTINAIDRDWQYEITGGDARSAVYAIRVLRRPGVMQLRVRYVYPSQMNRPPVSLISNDGVLEAPVGTQATLDVVTTEPVASATVYVKGQRIKLQPTREPNVYRLELPITESAPYRIELRSRRGMAGVSPQGTMIRALTDQSPQLNLLQDHPPIRSIATSRATIQSTTAPASNSTVTESPGGFDGPLRVYFQMLNRSK